MNVGRYEMGQLYCTPFFSRVNKTATLFLFPRGNEMPNKIEVGRSGGN